MEMIRKYGITTFLCLFLLFQSCLNVEDENFFSLHTFDATITEEGVTFSALMDDDYVMYANEFGIEYKFVYGSEDNDVWGRLVCPKVLQNNKFTTLLNFSELVKNRKDSKGTHLSEIKYIAYCDFLGNRGCEIAEEKTVSIALSSLDLKSSNEAMGVVNGNGVYYKESEILIVATPLADCYFTGWSDCESRDLRRVVILTSDTVITAVFAIKPYLTVKPNNANYGRVTGSSYYDVGDNATITAIPNENCYFIGWSDCDSKDLTRIIKVTSDTIITANFARNPYLTVKPNNVNYGRVAGSSYYDVGDNATITAIPNENCYFIGWSDCDSKDLTRIIKVTSDTIITANFARNPYLTVKPNNVNYGRVAGSSYYDVGDNATITAIPNENCYFIGWSDCDSKDLTRIIKVASDTTITANFARNPYLTVKPNNTNYGTVTGSGYYNVGSEVTITATPARGCFFDGWSDGSIENPYTVVVSSDMSITAHFLVDYNNYNYVDLGLSSGLKWATCNVGASKPEEYGDYFAWGEIFTKSVYKNSTYTYSENPTILPFDKDAAAMNMGGAWRMPTYEEIRELQSLCTWTRTTLNEIKGYRVEGPNGNFIFLPMAGGITESGLVGIEERGIYWLSTLNINYPHTAFEFHFGFEYVDWGYGSRYHGFSIRGVCP